MKQMSVKIVFVLFITLIISVLFSCSIENYATKKLTANNEILMYLNDNNLSVSPDSLGLVYIPIKRGNNVFPKENDIVAFHYIGYYLNGEVFDSSYDKSRPLIVQLGENQMIKGLEYSLLKMDKGAKAKVIIPFYMAYDNIPNAPVPAYSNLVFELELIDIDRK
jgi:FKBP-type peptidyl-prolyl cis-trans isomerase